MLVGCRTFAPVAVYVGLFGYSRLLRLFGWDVGCSPLVVGSWLFPVER